MNRTVFIGYDPRETAAFAVACRTARERSPGLDVRGLVLSELRSAGLYRRPTTLRRLSDGRSVLWDVVSDAPMSTQHACARFLIPFLVPGGWVAFMDGDMLVRGDIGKMIDGLDPRFALYCVKHRFDPPAGVKMDGQEQTRYARKNWSSFMVFNAGHPANRALTVDLVNTVPGRDLHRFCWLADADIGELEASWNFLVGHSDPEIEPDVVHFTEGCPDMPGYADVPFAEEWRGELVAWARGGA